MVHTILNTLHTKFNQPTNTLMMYRVEAAFEHQSFSMTWRSKLVPNRLH